MPEKDSDIKFMEELINNSSANAILNASEKSENYYPHTEMISHIKNLIAGEIESTVDQNIKDIVYAWLSDYKDVHPEDFITLLNKLKLILNKESSTEAQQALEVINDIESRNNFK